MDTLGFSDLLQLLELMVENTDYLCWLIVSGIVGFIDALVSA